MSSVKIGVYKVYVQIKRAKKSKEQPTEQPLLIALKDIQEVLEKGFLPNQLDLDDVKFKEKIQHYRIQFRSEEKDDYQKIVIYQKNNKDMNRVLSINDGLEPDGLNYYTDTLWLYGQKSQYSLFYAHPSLLPFKEMIGFLNKILKRLDKDKPFRRRIESEMIMNNKFHDIANKNIGTFTIEALEEKVNVPLSTFKDDWVSKKDHDHETFMDGYNPFNSSFLGRMNERKDIYDQNEPIEMIYRHHNSIYTVAEDGKKEKKKHYKPKAIYNLLDSLSFFDESTLREWGNVRLNYKDQNGKKYTFSKTAIIGSRSKISISIPANVKATDKEESIFAQCIDKIKDYE